MRVVVEYIQGLCHHSEANLEMSNVMWGEGGGWHKQVN